MNALSIEEAIGYGQPVRIFNIVHNEYMFASKDTIKGDNIVETRSGRDSIDGGRHLFVLSGDRNRFTIYSGFFKKYLFMSTDKMGGDNVLEAHYTLEERNFFRVVETHNPRQYRLLHTAYGQGVFRSCDVKKGDNVVEGVNEYDAAKLKGRDIWVFERA